MSRAHIALVLAALLPLAACDEAPSDTNVLTVGGIARLRADAQITIRVEQPGSVTTVTTADLAAASPASPLRIRTAKRGSMRIRYLVTTVPSDTIALETFDFALQDGFLYSVSGVWAPPNYIPTCFGCTDSRKVPFRGSVQPTTDSLLFYVFNDKPCRGCVY